MDEQKESIRKKRLIVGASGASGGPLLLQCLQLIREAKEYESWLIMSKNAKLTMEEETGISYLETEKLADYVLDEEDVGSEPASGSFLTEGMLIVPCSMKTIAGICSGYSDNLILRAADVTIKEHRPLILAARETPLSAIHLRNLSMLAGIPQIRITPPMMTFYNHPETIEDMV